MINRHIGSSFDDFLKEENLLEECTEAAIKKVLAFQIEKIMKDNHLTKSAMAKKMGASRESLIRLLDPDSKTVAFQTLKKAASVLGRRISVHLM